MSCQEIGSINIYKSLEIGNSMKSNVCCKTKQSAWIIAWQDIMTCYQNCQEDCFILCVAWLVLKVFMLVAVFRQWYKCVPSYTDFAFLTTNVHFWWQHHWIQNYNSTGNNYYFHFFWHCGAFYGLKWGNRQAKVGKWAG